MIESNHVNITFVKDNALKVENLIIMDIARNVINMNRDVRKKELIGRRINWRKRD